jgi:hypothetical protein
VVHRRDFDLYLNERDEIVESFASESASANGATKHGAGDVKVGHLAICHTATLI